MSTKVKVGIAAAIVAALVALIVLDQGTAPKDPVAGTPPGSGDVTVKSGPTRLLEAEEDAIIQKGNDTFKTGGADPAKSDIKGKPGVPVEVGPGKQPLPPPPAAAESEYTVKAGQTLETIAEEKLGDRKMWTRIAKANPKVNPNALRVGQKLAIPSKADEKAPEPVVASGPKPEASGSAAVDLTKPYVVQPGESLGSISTKVYNTATYWKQIADANSIEDPATIRAGMKLTLPNLERKASSNTAALPGSGQAATSTQAATGTTHKVEQGESLYKIAAKYAKDLGIEKMVELIVEANKDKIKDSHSLRVGLQLVIPEAKE